MNLRDSVAMYLEHIQSRGDGEAQSIHQWQQVGRLQRHIHSFWLLKSRLRIYETLGQHYIEYLLY